MSLYNTKINIYNCDCMTAMKDMEDNQFDLAIVDPPYELPKRSGQGAGKLQNRKIQEMHKLGWDIAPTKEYFDELFRVSKNQIIWGGNYFGDYLGKTRGIICWDKKQHWENFSAWEMAWTSFDCVARIFRYSTTAVRNKIHPTQKPVQLYKWLLEKYANEGDKILDTHLGSGSSALASDDLKFEFSGYEINEDYFNNAIKRLEEQQKQKTFF
tara:strand:- start:25672 stop:26307 length:636 start_codon:yes stop_codon:yes gene_type:complete